MEYRYKFIFLDLDDTIWDFHSNSRESIRDVYDSENMKAYYDDFDLFYKKYAQRNLELWELYGRGQITKDFLIVERFLHLLKSVGIDDALRAAQMNQHYLDVLSSKSILMPFALELLQYLQDSERPITILSNGFTEVQFRKIQCSGIEKYIAHVVLSEMVAALKPSPVIFNYAMELNNAKAHEVLMIGDSFDADIRGANASSIDALFLNVRNQQINLPDRVQEISSLKEAIEFLDKNMSV